MQLPFAFDLASPAMLGWLAAAAAPLLIHLWSRRRYRETTWAAMEYLLAAIQSSRRRITLEQWILLAIRTLIVVLIFLLIAWRGVAIARRAPDRFGALIALGATTILTLQALCHMGVVCGILPTKGLPLPFVSSGGSSLISSFALVGLLLNVSLRRRRQVDSAEEVLG